MTTIFLLLAAREGPTPGAGGAKEHALAYSVQYKSNTNLPSNCQETSS